MLHIGLTGGIGSGKSTVAGLFAALGVPVIDADEIAHRLTGPGQPATNRILDVFGSDVADNHGINRRRLAQRVFSDTGARRQLEEILHPLIRTEMEMETSRLKAPYCLLVIPLLIEAGQRDLVDRVLVVTAAAETRARRVHERDGRTLAEIRQIMTNQADLARQRAMADDWIQNEGSLEDLEIRVRELHRQYLEIAGA